MICSQAQPGAGAQVLKVKEHKGAGDPFRQVQVLSRVGQEASEGGCRMLKPLTPSSVQADRPLQWETKKTKQL